MCVGLSPATANVFGASLFSSGDGVIAPEGEETGGRGSLFADRVKGGMFAKIERKPPPSEEQQESAPNARYSFALQPGVKGLRDLIGRAEAGRANYDAVQHGARIRPSKPPTQMTIREIYDWIKATPGQPHAIGRYQFIPPTLRRVVRRVGVSETALFTPAVQDALADVLLADAGIGDFLQGEITKTAFMNNLAKIWAGFPTSNGRSYYHGYAGNYATMTWAQFKSAMNRIFPNG